MTDLILHEYAASGNCYKIRLTAAHLGIPVERHGYDVLAGETRTPGFLAEINPNGRIPVLQVGDDFLPESNAACVYLAHGSSLIPHDRFDHADMLRWMFWEQYNHEPNIATLRFWRRYVGEELLTPDQRGTIATKEEAGAAALALMDDHLSRAEWLAGGRFTIADIALYAYTHVADEGGVALSHYPNAAAWLARIAALPGHIGIDD